MTSVKAKQTRGRFPPIVLGQTYPGSELTVLSEYPDSSSPWKLFLTQCSCGEKKPVRGDLIRSGTTKSCGCLKKRTWSEQGKKILKTRHAAGLDLKMINYHGVQVPMHKTIRDKAVVSENLVHTRLEAGWSFETAVDTPRLPSEQRGPKPYKVNGEAMSLSEAVRRFSKVSRQTIYARLEDPKWKNKELIEILTSPADKGGGDGKRKGSKKTDTAGTG